MGFANFPAIATVLRALGIPGIPAPQYNSGVSDQPTSAVPDSNQSFDRVVVYGFVAGGSLYPGPLYFHYNILENR
jgi:hypothetical protein